MKSREYGTIATYSGVFGFIKPDDDAQTRDVFVHESELAYSPVHRGDRVSYDLAPDPFKSGKMLARGVTLENEKAPE
jgi:cold shock CspA family protein